MQEPFEVVGTLDKIVVARPIAELNTVHTRGVASVTRWHELAVEPNEKNVCRGEASHPYIQGFFVFLRGSF